MTKKILILGKQGQLGWELQRALAPLGSVDSYDRSSCDVADANQLRALIESAGANIIVNATAYTAVDKAEDEVERANAVNRAAVTNLAELAKANDALLVHYSTDYVFDGTQDAPYRENDSPHPLSVYGASKLAGEQAIIHSGCRNLIFRTSWVFGTHGKNFLKTILRLAAEREQLTVVADQFGAPTSAELIADVTAHALRSVVTGTAEGGLYHLTASGETSWHGYANFILEQALALGLPLKAAMAQPISSNEYPVQARRPLNSRLNCDKLQSAFDLTLPDWRYHVRLALAELLGQHR